jgi:hypothetical protein
MVEICVNDKTARLLLSEAVATQKTDGNEQ